MIVPGDNPSYGAGNDRLNNSQDADGYQIPALTNNQNTWTQNGQQISTASPQERDFTNPIYYGSEEVQDREFDNPVYAADDLAAQEEAEPEDHYTIPDSPPYNVYDRVAGDHPLGCARVGTVSANGEDSDDGVYSTITT